MIVDVALAAVVLAFGLLGMRSGAIRQVSYWAGLAAAYFSSSMLSDFLTPLLAPVLGVPPAFVKVGLGQFLFAALGAFAAWAVHRALSGRGRRHLGGVRDRLGGFLMGMGNGAAIAYVVLSAALFFEKPVVATLGALPAAVDGSVAVAFMRARDPFALIHFNAAERLRKLAEAAHDPLAAQRLDADPKLKALLDDPAVKAAVSNPALLKSLHSGNLSALQKDPRFTALLNDPRLNEAVR